MITVIFNSISFSFIIVLLFEFEFYHLTFIVHLVVYIFLLRLFRTLYPYLPLPISYYLCHLVYLISVVLMIKP